MITAHWPERLLLGLSGGADSVALLLMLLEEGARPSAVHVNHGLRGEASDGDEAFVRQLCREKEVPLMVYRASPPEHPGETWARQARYGFFREAMQAAGAEALVLAHHLDDQAETLLMHLMRGCGLTGLTGMAADSRAEGMRILRPLLDMSRSQLRDYLVEKGQSWREDASNTDPRYLRNAIRQDVLPRMNGLAPGASARMAHAALLLREDEDALRQLTDDFLRRYGTGKALPLAALTDQPAGLQKRILRRWWEMQRTEVSGERSLSMQQTEALAALVMSPASAQCNLPGGWHGWRGWTHLHMLSPETAKGPEACAVHDGAAMLGVTVRLLPFDGRVGDGRRWQLLPRALLPEMTLRTRQKGDWIRPFGSGRQLLQDYLVNRRVDAPFRDRIPLLCRGSEVLLAGGVGAGEGLRLDQQKMNTDDHVLLCLEGAMPWLGANE